VLLEQDQLLARVRTLLDRVKGTPAHNNILHFGRAVLRSVALVNVTASWSINFFKSDKTLYTTYSRLVQAEARRLALLENDRRRQMVGSGIYGSEANQICYAALSLGCPGLTSYGAVSIQLRDIAIEARASVLEENSYCFFERHGIGAHLTAPIPAGFRAPWPTRHLVAMAKLGQRITDATTRAEFAALLLRAGTGRENDDFVEVHIYGSFDIRAVERVRVPRRPTKETPRMELELLKRAILSHNLSIEEV
jgi:hypothetical protein